MAHRVCFKMNKGTVPRAAPQSKMLPGGFYFSSTVSRYLLLHPLLLKITSNSKHLGNSQEFSCNGCGRGLQQSHGDSFLAWETRILKGSNFAPPHLCPHNQAQKKQHKAGHLKSMVTYHKGAFNSTEIRMRFFLSVCFPTLWNGNLKHFPLNSHL